jgi:hypothetical protein
MCGRMSDSQKSEMKGRRSGIGRVSYAGSGGSADATVAFAIVGPGAVSAASSRSRWLECNAQNKKEAKRVLS